MGTRAANVLRAVVAGTREAGDKRQIRARLQRAWDGLSTAEKIALGGTLAAAIMGGGAHAARWAECDDAASQYSGDACHDNKGPFEVV